MPEKYDSAKKSGEIIGLSVELQTPKNNSNSRDLVSKKEKSDSLNALGGQFEMDYGEKHELESNFLKALSPEWSSLILSHVKVVDIYL